MVTTKTDPAVPPDESLARRAAADLEAFAELYRRYLCPVFRFVRARLRDDATAEDVTAHVFFKALSSASSFRGEGSYRAWLFQIANNAVATWHARKRAADLLVEDLPEAADPTPSPASQAITQEQRGVVWGAVATLPPAQRQVVALRYINDLSVAEIAKATRRSHGAVRILLHRARQNLRKGLEGAEVLA
jgi:RNA polymerase sigma-70 factor, ECF subfamily